MLSKPSCLWISGDDAAKAVSDHINGQFDYGFQMKTATVINADDFSEPQNLAAVVIDEQFLPFLNSDISLTDRLKREQVTVIIAGHDNAKPQDCIGKSLFSQWRRLDVYQTDFDDLVSWIQGLVIEWKMSRKSRTFNASCLRETHPYADDQFPRHDPVYVDDEYYERVFLMVEQGHELAFNLERIIETYPALNLLAEYESATSRLVYFSSSSGDRIMPRIFGDDLPDKVMEDFIIRLERAIELTVESFAPFVEVVEGWSAFGRVKSLREKGFSIHVSGSAHSAVEE